MRIEEFIPNDEIHLIRLTNRDSNEVYSNLHCVVVEKLDAAQVMIRTRGMLEHSGMIVRITDKLPTLLTHLCIILTSEDIFTRYEN